MSGYNRKWNPDEDDWPARSITFERLTQRLDRNLPKHAEPTAIHREEDLGTPEFPQPSIHWIENWQGKSICFNTVKGVEKICREEAERIGFSCVIIRSGVHAKTNQYAEDGSVLTEYNARTGRYTNVLADDDPHITVYMGFNLDELVGSRPHLYRLGPKSHVRHTPSKGPGGEENRRQGPEPSRLGVLAHLTPLLGHLDAPFMAICSITASTCPFSTALFSDLLLFGQGIYPVIVYDKHLLTDFFIDLDIL